MSHKFGKTKIAAVASLAIIFSAAYPQSARADLLGVQDIVSEIQRSAKIAIDYMANIKDNLLSQMMHQADADSRSLETQNHFQLKTNVDHTTDATTSKVCSTSVAAAARTVGAAGARSWAAGATGGATNQGILTPSARLTAACSTGNISTTANPAIKLAIPNCTTDPTRIDADINRASIDVETQLPTESSISLNQATGQINIPTNVTGFSAPEKAYVDAMNVCINDRGREADSLGATKVANLGTPAFDGQRLDKLYRSGSFYSCVANVNDHVALRAANANLSPQFKQLYNTQQTWCASLIDQGVKDAAGLLANCQTNGISFAELRKIEEDRYSSPDYRNKLTGQNLSAEDISMLQHQNEDTRAIISHLEKTNDLLMTLVMTLHGGGATPAPSQMNNPATAASATPADQAVLHRIPVSAELAR